MFKWIMTNSFLKRQGLLLPASTHIANKQARTNFYYKQVRRIHPDYATDATRTHYMTQYYDKS
jgi:hypothetical protein